MTILPHLNPQRSLVFGEIRSGAEAPRKWSGDRLSRLICLLLKLTALMTGVKISEEPIPDTTDWLSMN